MVVLGTALWIVRRRAQLRPRHIAQASGLFVFGLVVLVGAQVGNNAIFDQLFPRRTVEQVPTDVQAIRE